ncbi:MAG: helix-turn-helix transcriptional regulator [Bacilli bacterium]|nr:helix-turn-helix transcriptional regulator [Bacilli bacterium]MBR1377182.1 helix-turn-helix transcriptional regulator [Bacilli bacterium]
MNLERLQHLRVDNDLKQSDLADFFNIKQVNISNWENNKEIIPLDKLNGYANYFDVSLDYLTKLSNKKNKYDKINLNKSVVGKNLRAFRKHYDITQVELATFLNTSHSTISAYESGKTLILTSFAYQICKRYNISLDWLCGKSNIMNLTTR